jgi:hypothetical protein
MQTKKYGTHSPKDAVCAKCGGKIETGQGRRYRMKWCHEHCLPATRLARVKAYREPASITDEVVARREKYAREDAERIAHAARSLRQRKPEKRGGAVR